MENPGRPALQGNRHPDSVRAEGVEGDIGGKSLFGSLAAVVLGPCYDPPAKAPLQLPHPPIYESMDKEWRDHPLKSGILIHPPKPLLLLIAPRELDSMRAQ